jgi:hypothetical protein
MTQISRPFQIALGAMVLFAAVWFVALRGHSSGTESASTPASSGGQSAAPPKAAASDGSSAQGSTYKGSAPGVSGLSHAIAKARGAVAQSKQNSQQLQQNSTQASSGGASQGTSGGTSPAPSSTTPSNASGASSTAGTHAATPTKPQSAAAAPGASANTTAPSAAAKAPAKPDVASMQPVVEHQLQQGKLVAILFWNPKGADDVVVRHELLAAGHALGGRIAIHLARSSQVGSFGKFTRTVQVYGTPTILMINSKGQTSSLTGITDSFGIVQAVKEAKSAK